MVRKIVHFIDQMMVSLAVVAIFTMMLTIVYDAVLRYGFDISSTLSFSLSECYLMTALVFFSIAHTQKLNGHTRILLVYRFFPQILRKFFNVLSNVVTLVVFALIGYMGWVLTARAYMNTEMYIGIYTWPLYLAYAIVPIGSLAMVFQCLLDIYDSLVALFNKDSEDIQLEEQSAL